MSGGGTGPGSVPHLVSLGYPVPRPVPPGLGKRAPAQYRVRVDNREAIGSWLSGPRAAAEGMGGDFGYRGERLGLPKEGPGSAAPLGRRFGALFIDWALCLLIAFGLLADSPQSASNYAIGVLLLMNVLTIGTAGSTIGKRLLGLRVVSENHGRLGFGRVVVRSVLLCLAVPALVWDRDGRGLHDRLARAVQVRI